MSGLERWRYLDTIHAARILETELRILGLRDEAELARRLHLRLKAQRDHIAYVGPTGRLVETDAG